MNKYDPLEKYLSVCGQDTVTLTFGEIETIIGDALPLTAHKKRQWWENAADEKNMHIQQKAWYRAGYRTEMNMGDINAERAVFVKL